MKNEMDILKMTPSQRVCWLKANRLTLLAVAVVWIGMIIWELTAGRCPWFLISMVPVFALLRFCAYTYFRRMPDPSGI